MTLPVHPDSPTGVIPDALFFPDKKQSVIAFLRAAPVHGERKLAWFDGWQLWTQAAVTEQERESVLHSGVDY